MSELPKRAYLVINHHAQTYKDDYTKEIKRRVVEQAHVTNNLKDRHIAEATIIIDILNKKIIKSRLNTVKTTEGTEFYIKTYAPEIKQFFKKFFNIDYYVERKE